MLGVHEKDTFFGPGGKTELSDTLDARAVDGPRRYKDLKNGEPLPKIRREEEAKEGLRQFLDKEEAPLRRAAPILNYNLRGEVDKGNGDVQIQFKKK